MSIAGIHPIFITGVYRTGTTLLSRILDAHSDLSVTYDSVHFMRFCYGEYLPVSEKKNYIKLLQDIKERCEARWERSIDMEPVIKRLDKRENVDYATIYNEVMSHLLLNEGKSAWGEKTLIAWSQIPIFLKMFPDGKAIQVIRDPRDVISSNKKLTYEPGLRYLDACFACLSSMRAAIYYERNLPKDSYMTVRYEDLVREPEETTKQVCKMLNVPFEEAMVNAEKFRDYKGQSWEKNTSYNGLTNKISDESVGRYLNFLNAVEIFFAEMIDRTVMEHFGYEFEGRLLNHEEWGKLYSILTDEFIESRYRNWLKTNDGVEAYPSAPPRILREGPADE